MISFILLCTLFAVVFGQNPGFRTVITSKGFDYIDAVGIPILQQQLANVNVPDISGSTSVDVVGKIDYSLSNIKLSNLKIPTSDIKSDASGLTLDASSISLNGNANWHYRESSWPHISDSGSADLSVSSVTLSVSVIVEKDAQGHPTIKATRCSLSIGHLGINFHGGASWLYNLFDDNIASALKSSLQGQICSAATDAINKDGDKALESLPVIVKIDSTSEVTYALLSNPVFNTNYIETKHKGEFLSIKNPTDAPISPTVLPNVTSYDRMMYIWLTDYIANTASIVYQQAGMLQYTITPDIVPKDFPIQLNTSSFAAIIPALYKKYPNMAMEVLLTATKPPVLQIVPSSANFTITGTLNVNVIQPPNNTIVNAFVLGLVVYTDVRVWVHVNGTNQVISGNCTLLKFDLNLLSSNVGTFPVKLIESSVNLLVQQSVIPLVNLYFNAGLMIPTVDGLSFVSPHITLGQGYVLIDTDINYKPSFAGQA